MRRVLLVAVFITVLLTVLVAGHLYLAQKLVWGPDLPAPWSGLVLAGLAAGALTLVLQPLGERLLAPPASRWIAWPASLWMGTAFFLLVGGLATDLLGLLAGAAAVGAPPGTGAGRVQAVLILALGLGAAGRGLYEVRRGPALRRETVRLARWPAALDGFRIVQISDVHIGPILDRAFAAELTARVNALRPDLVVNPGDLVDGDVRRLGAEVAPFAALEAAHGVYFVTGNHDYYSGADAWVARLEELGLRALRNTRVAIGPAEAGFDLAGVEDRHAHLVSRRWRSDLAAALAGREPQRPVVLLAHDPLTFKDAAPLGVDLQLSGHTHGGQIWPFRYLVRLSTPFVAGHYRRGDAQLYVSRGTGFWGPAMRLFAPAEITKITVRTVR